MYKKIFLYKKIICRRNFTKKKINNLSSCFSSSGPSGSVSPLSVWSCWLKPAGCSCPHTTCTRLPRPHWTCTCTKATPTTTTTWPRPCCPTSSPTLNYTPVETHWLGGLGPTGRQRAAHKRLEENKLLPARFCCRNLMKHVLTVSSSGSLFALGTTSWN